MIVAGFLDAFISYGRADSKAFVIALHQRLCDRGLQVWLDQNDIPLAVDFQRQIDEGIRQADNFIFIISPHAVNSPYCAKEIELALQFNKRIIPILHVEQISFETWKQRQPSGTDADWETFKQGGLHSSFPNMHPEIGKINWVYSREEIDDFGQSFSSLLEIFERQRSYVRQHTEILCQALDWKKHREESQYLLTGTEKEQAENWLKTRFKHEQPPCIPSNLHCEFISESIKNANNLMTHVFLSHAEENRDKSEQIRLSLMREGFTVWTNKTDIQIGSDFQAAIYRGIEEADNVVYLLSPASLQSKYCQLELEYALKLNKRIIPILVAATDTEATPIALRELQYIDLTDNLLEIDYQKDESQLIQILRQDAAYYERHKILLAKGLKWERQKRNPGILLRGYNLRHAESWLKVAQQREHHAAIPLQAEFIAASTQQATVGSLDVFISYSRTDSDFARKLNDALQIQGKSTWFDQESIASGTDFQQEIYRGIETSNSFLFIISPDAISSTYCDDEVEYARKLNKRIVTILYRAVDPGQLHPVLASVQWIDFNQPNGDFYTNFGELIRTLDTDQEYMRMHTRLLMRSLEWEALGYDPSFLLRGTDLIESEQWLKRSTGKEPTATELQTRFIHTSRQSPLRQAKRSTVVLSSLVAAIALICLRAAGWLQPLELKAFDQLLKLRPHEPVDPRLVIVEISEQDITRMEDEVGKGTLKDPSLNRLLQRLERYQPRVIGLDLYRNFKVDPSVPELAQRLRQTDRFISACKFAEIGNDGQITNDGVGPAPELPPEQVGFSDIVTDQDSVIRRQPVLAFPGQDSICPAKHSLGFLLAKRYLELEPDQAIALQIPENANAPIRLGPVTLPELNQAFQGAYGFLVNDGNLGVELLVNYRAPNGDPEKLAERLTLGKILKNQVPESTLATLKDRIVLIGITSQASVKDTVITPYKEIPGVIYQGQVASQMVSAVLDGRMLLRMLPAGVDLLWIGVWAFVGGIIIYCFRSPKHILIAIAIAGCGLIILCWIGLVAGGIWLPLIPPLGALLVTTGMVFHITNYRYTATKSTNG